MRCQLDGIEDTDQVDVQDLEVGLDWLLCLIVPEDLVGTADASVGDDDVDGL